MNIIYPYRQLNVKKKRPTLSVGLGILGLTSLLPFAHAANLNEQNLTSAFVSENQSKVNAGEVFSQVVMRISKKRHLILHYPISLSSKSVNSVCNEDDINKLFSCLLGGSFVDMAIKSNELGTPEEIWIVGSQDTANSVAKNQLVNIDEHNIEDAPTDLLVLAQSENTLERSQAISNMAVTEISDPVLAKKILSDALEDKDPDIRAKALNSVVKVDSENARSVFVQMLTDKEVSVRLATVVAAYHDAEVLNMAQGDSDEQVRQLAEISLNKLKSQ